MSAFVELLVMLTGLLVLWLVFAVNVWLALELVWPERDA